MEDRRRLNANRFQGFASVYDSARPQTPKKAVDYILSYLGRSPLLVVDIGCGTGLSAAVWSGISDRVIGIEPSADMLNEAHKRVAGLGSISLIKAFSDETGLPDHSVDVVTCSQSFHWMEPNSTLQEVSRILKPGGVFAVYDCDWPPVCNWEAELAYDRLFEKAAEIESAHPELLKSSHKWDKARHLANIINSGYFRYAREIVFSSSEPCNANRFIGIAMSQGGLQNILKVCRSEIEVPLSEFRKTILRIFGEKEFTIDFCYRMRLGIK